MCPILLTTAVGCAPAPPTPADDTSERPVSGAPGAYVYRCGSDERFVVRVEEDAVRLVRGAESRTLPQVVAASGTRYSDGSITFWSKGLDARLETPGDTLLGCHGTAAGTPWEISRLLGYELRAVGQEPGWMVEIEPARRMHVLADYGEIDFEAGAPVESNGRQGQIVYRAPPGAHAVEVTVTEEPCQDTMSGERFPLTVRLSLDGTEYDGCGRRLR